MDIAKEWTEVIKNIRVKDIRKFPFRNLIIFSLFLILDYKLIADGLSREFMTFINGKTLSCICAIIIIGVSSIKKGNLVIAQNRKRNIDCLLIILTIVIFIRHDTFWIQELCMIVALVIIFDLSFETFTIFIYASCFAVAPFVIRWILALLDNVGYLGNRGPIYFTTIAILLASLMYIKDVNWKWQYLVLLVAVVLDFVGQSRTYLIVCAIAFCILTFYNFKGVFTIKKLLLLLLGVTAVVFIAIKLQDQIIELFTNKWSGQTTIFTGRSMMWLDVLSEFKWIGYEEGYIQNKYLLGNVHNAFIQSYVSYGIIVAFLYIILVVNSIIKCIKYREDRMIQGLTAIFIPVTIGAFFESNFILENEYLFLGICNAFVIGQINQESNKALENRVCHEEKI